MDILQLTLNNTLFTLDKATGALVDLTFPGVSSMQKLTEKNTYAGLIDIAWPVHFEYETLRANPTGKVHAVPPVIDYDDRHITITYSELPQTYDAPLIEETLKGRVYARIEMKALEDGKSVSLRCFVRNNSHAPVEQIIFPNFDNLTATDTKDNARMTMTAGVINPFTFGCPRGMRGAYYDINLRTTGLTLTPTGMQTGPMMGRWFDWGSFKGGFSIFRKCWGWDKEDPQKMGESDKTWMRYDVRKDQVRVCNLHNITLNPGEEFESDEYIMTAHTGTWIFGCEAYKAWVRQNVKRVVPMPRRAKEMMGFRTLCMTNYPYDPNETSCDYNDMPALAKDAGEHGLTELNVWKGFNYTLPLTEDCFYENWGGLKAWNEAVKKCEEYGVTVAAFVSWLSLWSPTCVNYGIEQRSGDWAGSDNTIPRMGAHYAQKWSCWQLWDHSQPRWAKDVLDGLRFLRDKAGCPTISWDQYVLGNNSDNTLHDIINEYRLETEKMYPGTTWSAESTLFFESEIDNSDYTWNGASYRGSRWDWDTRPLSYIFNLMRPNMNVGNNPKEIRLLLIDNLMMNVNPGEDPEVDRVLFADIPEQSAALKTCWSIRKRYMDYFADGEILGDCVLSDECPGKYVTAYRKDGKLLLFVMNDEEGAADLHLNLAPFIGEGKRSAVIRDEALNVIGETAAEANGALTVSGPEGCLTIVEIG